MGVLSRFRVYVFYDELMDVAIGRYMTKRILFVEEKLLKSIGVKYFYSKIDHLKNAKSFVRRIHVSWVSENLCVFYNLRSFFKTGTADS